MPYGTVVYQERTSKKLVDHLFVPRTWCSSRPSLRVNNSNVMYPPASSQLTLITMGGS